MECERGSPKAILSAGRDLAKAYAEIVRVVESPPPISNYVQMLTDSSEVLTIKLTLAMILCFAVLVGICVVAFRPPLNRIIEVSLFLLLATIVFSFLIMSKFSRRGVWPIITRVLTINCFVKVMAHHHIRRHLHTLARQYAAEALTLTNDAKLRKPLSETAESFRNMAEQLQGFRNIIYISAPPVLISLLSQLNLNWKQIFSAAPFWLTSIAGFYIFYVMIICFSRKREIFKGDAIQVPHSLSRNIYALEDLTYDAIGVSKKRELPLDLLLFGGNGAVLVVLAFGVLLYGSGAGGGIVGSLGGGRFADLVIPLFGGMVCIFVCAYLWRSRVADALA